MDRNLIMQALLIIQKRATQCELNANNGNPIFYDGMAFAYADAAQILDAAIRRDAEKIQLKEAI